MIILISGSVGSGKTTIGKEIANKLGFEYINLTSIAEKFKVADIKHLDTFDFDLGEFLVYEEDYLSKNRDKNLVLESHFSHFLNSKYVDFLFILNRHQKELLKEYTKRNYNQKKIEDNLEVENFNLCFIEAIENGYIENKNLFLIDNDDLNHTISQILFQVGKTI